MTGLDPDHDEILSLACFITDSNLNLLDEKGYIAVVHHDKATLDGKMSAWSKLHLGQLGDECQRSTKTAQEVAQDLLGYMERYVEAPRTALLAGNSVHADGDWKLHLPLWWSRVLTTTNSFIPTQTSIQESNGLLALSDVRRQRHQGSDKTMGTTNGP